MADRVAPAQNAAPHATLDIEQTVDELKAAARDTETVAPSRTSPKVYAACIGVCLTLWACAWLYIAYSFDPAANSGNLQVAVLNCDQGYADAGQFKLPPPFTAVAANPAANSIGSVLLASTAWNASNPLSSKLNWVNFTCTPTSPSLPPAGLGCPAAAEPGCMQQLRDAILEGGLWGAVYLPSNLSSNFFTTAFLNVTNATIPSAASGGSPATPQQPPFRPVPIVLLKATGKQLVAAGTVDGVVRGLQAAMSAVFTMPFATAPLLSRTMSPLFYAAPLPLATQDLAPVRYTGLWTATVFINMLLWVSTFVLPLVLSGSPLPVEAPAAQPRGWAPRRGAVPRALCRHVLLVLSLLLALSALMVAVPVALGAAAGGGAQFVGANAGVAIAFLWVATMAFVGVNGLLVTLVGPLGALLGGLLLLLSISCSQALFPWELTSRFFYLGNALPLYWAVHGLRSIFFGADMGRLWQAWLVLAAWAAVCNAATVALWWRRTTRRLRQHVADNADAARGGC